MLTVGSITITDYVLVWAFCFLLITLLLVRHLKLFLDTHFTHFRHIIDVDPKRYRFLKHFATGFVFMVGVGVAIYMIPALRSISVSIFAGAGVLAIIVGFAAQATLSNVISGVFIAVFKPFRVGDWIQVGERYGTVEDITLRHTIIRNQENKRIVIPNSVISNEVIENSTLDDRRICKWVEISVSYDADVDKALAIMAQEAEAHPLFLDVRTQKDKEDGLPAVRTKVVGFGDSSVKLRAWVWTRDITDAYKLGWDLNRTLKARFDKAGIEIPFPYRTIVYKKDLRKRHGK